MTTKFNFAKQLSMSATVDVDQLARSSLTARFPTNRGIHRTHVEDDKLGADYIVLLPHARPHTVDVKVRAKDYAPRPDIALEIWSNVDARRVGWTRDPAKLADWILWVWQDSGRSLLVPFHALQAVFSAHWEEWSQRYGVSTQNQMGGSRSQCLFLPSADLRDAINAHLGFPGP